MRGPVEHPIHMLQADQEKARSLSDPSSDLCALATVDADGCPAVRTLVLWEVRDEGPVLLTNITSPKWHHLSLNGKFELLILWTTLQRQYRLRGGFVELEMGELTRLWSKKRYELKLLDHYYLRGRAQSDSMPSFDEMTHAMESLKQEFHDPDAVPMPHTAKGLQLVISEIDVWEGNTPCPTRTLFVKNADAQWTKKHLVP
jgi:pyridoxamine 5'-phosphate oxidase